MKYLVTAILLGMILVSSTAQGQTFYFTGNSGNDFFDEMNWNSLPGGGGSVPLAGTIEPRIGFTLDLIIDGDSVSAIGPVDPLVPGGFIVLDIGAGGNLSLLSGSDLQVINNSANAQFEVSSGATFSLVDSILGVDDDIFLRGTTSFTGGSVETFADDIEFLSSAVTINGTEFSSDDSTIFRIELTPAAGSSIVGATFQSANRIGIREFNVTVTDTTFDVTGDIEDVFGTDLDTATATLTLLGDSSLTADQIQEGVKLRLGGTSKATLLNQADADELTWFTQSSFATLDSTDAQLILFSPQTNSSAAKVFNGVTGQSYAADSSTWNVTNWNGTDAVTLSITSLPSESDADFDGDGDVDGRDFLIWQRGFGLTDQENNSMGDANGDGEVDGLDLADWQSQYGLPALAAVNAVPELSSFAIACGVLSGICCVRRRNFFRSL